MPGNWAPPQGLPPNAAWQALNGKPSVTVSPIGLSTSGVTQKNNGADYGPDTLGTTTSGIQEAINSGATSIVLLKVKGTQFATSSSILLPADHGINLVSEGMQDWNSTTGPPNNTPLAYISYSGAGYAIDTAANPIQNIQGYIDGLFIETPNGSGVHFNQVIYNIGFLGCVGGGVAGSIGINFDFLSAPNMGRIGLLRVGVYPLHIRINQDHFQAEQIETSYTIAGQNAIIEHVAGWGFRVGYWHHLCSGAAPTNGLVIDSSPTESRAMSIGSLLWEPSTYSSPTSYVIDNNSPEALQIAAASATGTFDITSYLNGTVGLLEADTNTIRTPTGILINNTGIAGYPNGWLLSQSPNYLNIDRLTVLTDIIIEKGPSAFHSVPTAGMGLPPIFGLDARTGLTAADASAITLYTVPAAGQTFRLTGRIYATAGASATYVLKWTEGGVVVTKTLTITAVDTDVDLQAILIQPDNGTAITAQLTAVTTSTVNVAATVERVD